MKAKPTADAEGTFSFVVTIPSYGKPEKQKDHLLKLVERHVQLSISSRATVEPYEPKAAPRRRTTKRTAS